MKKKPDSSLMLACRPHILINSAVCVLKFFIRSISRHVVVLIVTDYAVVGFSTHNINHRDAYKSCQFTKVVNCNNAKKFLGF